MIFLIFLKVSWVLRPHPKMTDSVIINYFTIYATITTMPFNLSRLNRGVADAHDGGRDGGHPILPLSRK